MEYTFANGTAQQKSLWQEATQHLLHLPVGELPLKINVTFVPPGDLVNRGHTDLALTTYEYDSNDSSTEVRNDAPAFGGVPDLVALAASMGLEYSPTRHFHETAVHETGHSAFAALPKANRVKIAQMFGAKSDSAAELFPASKAWEDRIGEAIAETFKEAFLPRRYRVFPNRTNIHIPYSRYPEFRELFRVAKVVKEEVVIEPNVPFPVNAGETIGYRFPLAKLPWFFEYPVKEKAPVDVQFQAWEIRFVWSFTKWFETEEGRVDETQMILEIIDVFDEEFFSGSYFGTQTWYFATAEKPAVFHSEASHVILTDPDEAFKGGRWTITPEIPEPFAFSGAQLTIHNGQLWLPPSTFGEDFLVPSVPGPITFGWKGNTFIYLGSRVAAGQARSSFPPIFQPAYPKFMLDGADIFRMGQSVITAPPNGGKPNGGVENYSLSALAGEPTGQRASVYEAGISLPTEKIVIPGEEEERRILAASGSIAPGDHRSGRRPRRMPVSGFGSR